jgi:hypothetical protein
MRSLCKILLSLGALVGALAALTYMQAQPIRTFCAQLPKSATPADVQALAESAGFIVLGKPAESAPMSVINHKIYFWRYACQVKFSGGRVSEAHFMSAD